MNLLKVSFLQNFFFTFVPVYICFTISFSGLFCSKEAMVADRTLECSKGYIWLEYGKQIKKRDGSVIQIVHIKIGNDLNNFEQKSLRAVYRINNRDNYYLAQIMYDNSEQWIEIQSGETSCFDLSVFAGYTNDDYFAETSFYLFGKSNEQINRDVCQNKTGYLPIVKLISPTYNYWPQTGQEFRFGLNPEMSNYSDIVISVFEKSCKSFLNINDTGEFAYLPPHDKNLDKLGSTAYKSCVLYIDRNLENSNCKTTYTVLLHRSRFAHLKLKSGVFLFSGTIIFFVLIVLASRCLPGVDKNGFVKR